MDFETPKVIRQLHESHTTRYSNMISTSSTAGEINISFGDVYHNPVETEKVIADIFATITLSPENTKILILMLQREIEYSKEVFAESLARMAEKHYYEMKATNTLKDTEEEKKYAEPGKD